MVETPVIWSLAGTGSTLLPKRFAKAVSYSVKSATVGIRLCNYVADSAFGTARVSVLAALRVARRTCEGVIIRANDEVYGADQWAKRAMDQVDQFAVLVNLGASFAFHFTSSTVSGAAYLVQDGLHYVNGVLGDTETSRALNSILGLARRELGKNEGVYGFLSGAIYFVILQSRGWKQTANEVDTKLLWDVLVFDTGETIARQLPASTNHLLFPETIDIPEVVGMISDRVEYKVRMSETSTRVFTVDMKIPSGCVEPQLDLPPGATLLSRQTIKKEGNGNLQRVTFKCQTQKDTYQSGHTILGADSGRSSTPTPIEAAEYSTLYNFPGGGLAYNIAKFMRYSSAAYGQTFMWFLGINEVGTKFPQTDSAGGEHHSFAHHAKIPVGDIFLSSYTDNAVYEECGIPLVHFAVYDHEARAVVLAIRGTLGLEDFLTDFTFDYQDLHWQGVEGRAHGGMLTCASLLVRDNSKVMKILGKALNEYPDYGFIMCGHSLGGGVSAMMATLLTKTNANGQFYTKSGGPLPPGRPVKCFCYGPPATMSNNLRLATRGLITSVVYGLDMVPCLSLGLIQDYQNISKVVRQDPRGAAYDLLRRFVAQLSVPRNPLSMYDEIGDDRLWSIMKTLRAAMRSEKLLPSGEVIHINRSTAYETINGRNTKATRITGHVVMDAEKRFGEPVFGRGVFHHSPVFYERALKALEEALSS